MNNAENKQTSKKSSNLIYEIEKINFREFYPFRQKPKIILIIKKIIGYSVLLNAALFLIFNVLGWQIDSGIKINTGTNANDLYYKKNIYDTLGLLYFFISFFFVWQLLQKQKYDRDRYKVPMLLVIFGIVYYGVWGFELIKRIPKPDFGTSGFYSFYQIFHYLSIGLNFMIIMEIILIFILKPQIDREKIIEFQKELYKLSEAKQNKEQYGIDFDKFK